MHALDKMNTVLRLPHLLRRDNIKKAYFCIKNYGFKTFARKAKGKILDIVNSGNDSTASNNHAVQSGKIDSSSSKPIWDNSFARYQKDNFKLYWELLPEVQKYQYRCMTGNENMDFLTFTLKFCKENFESNKLRALWIGCMDSIPGPEVTQFESGMFSKIEVMDLAEGLLDKQRRMASKRGIKDIEYRKQDLNEVVLEKNAYDVIFAVGTIHHVENLELLFEQINGALKGDGKFIIREYIGPNRLQFTDTQLSIINEILSILPEKYRTMNNGSIKKIAQRPDMNYLIKIDPSESARSQDIIEVMKERLEITTLSYTGGTILHPLLSDIASNFERDQESETILKLLIFFEKTLIEWGALPSDYVFCIAQKKL